MLKKTVEASILQYILEFAEQVRRGGDILLQAYELTSQQWTILLHLARDPNLPFFRDRSPELPVMASELATYFNVSRANITNLMNSLADKNLIVQEEDSKDRRRKLLYLTAQGQHLVATVDTLRHHANGRLFTAFDHQEKHQFFSLIDRCLNYVEVDNKKGR